MRREGPFAWVDVRGADGVRAVRIQADPEGRSAFDSVFASPEEPVLAPIDRGEAWVVLLPAGVDRALSLLRPRGGIRVTTRAAAAPEARRELVPVDDSRGRVDREPPRAAVVLAPGAWRGLTGDQRSAAAGLAGLPLSTLDGLAAADLPVVLQAHRRAADAVRAAERLARETGLPLEAATGGGAALLLGTLALAATAAATALGTATFALLGVWLLTGVGALLTLALSAFAARAAWSWNLDRALLAGAREAEREAAEERVRRAGDPRLARAWASLADARVTLAAAGLPSTASADLRAVLKAVEQELDELDARARRGAGDGARIGEEARALEAILAEMTEAIGRWTTDGEDEALAAIAEATRHARERHLEGG